MMMKITYLVYTVSVLLSKFITGRIILPTFSWDPRNEIFSGDVCGGDYAHIAVPLDSEMYFLCPSVAMLSKIQIGYVSKTKMYENMYMVSKSEFERCEIDHDGANATKVLMCDNPKDPNVIKFNRFFFTSLSTHMAFQRKKTYYFIATSNGEENSLTSLKGGRCKTNNMRIAITICSRGENCEDKKNLCASEKKADFYETGTTRTPLSSSTEIKVTTLPSTSSTTTTTITGDVKLSGRTPASAPHSGEENPKEKSSGFGVMASLALIGGLAVGVIFGVIIVLVSQKYAKRFQERKDNLEKTGSDDAFHGNVDKKYVGDNDGYRHSKEIKRLLSTSSNGSSERYSNIPVITAPQRPAAPVGSIQV